VIEVRVRQHDALHLAPQVALDAVAQLERPVAELHVDDERGLAVQDTVLLPPPPSHSRRFLSTVTPHDVEDHRRAAAGREARQTEKQPPTATAPARLEGREPRSAGKRTLPCHR